MGVSERADRLKAVVGKKRKKEDIPKGAAGVKWHRIRDNWADLERIGINPDLGTVIGRMYLFGILSARQASAARLYAEVTGRYDRYHVSEDALQRRTAPSPAYQRGSRGRHDEIAQHQFNGTIKEYERQARRARRAYSKLDACLPNDTARQALDEIAIHEREVNSAIHDDICKVLNRIADKFQFRFDYD